MFKLRYSDIVKISRYAYNKSNGIIEQAQVLDQIVLNNSSDEILGVIIEQCYEKEVEDNYIKIKTELGEICNIKSADIKEVKKVINKKYVQQKELQVKPGELYVCGVLIDSISVRKDDVGGGRFYIPFQTNPKTINSDAIEGDLVVVTNGGEDSDWGLISIN